MTDAWRPIAPPPFDAQLAVAGWTGLEMFVTGGIQHGGLDTFDGAGLYDPETDTWRLVSPPPHQIERNADIAWTGRQFVIWPRESNSPGMVFEPASNLVGPADVASATCDATSIDGVDRS